MLHDILKVNLSKFSVVYMHVEKMIHPYVRNTIVLAINFVLERGKACKQAAKNLFSAFCMGVSVQALANH